MVCCHHHNGLSIALGEVEDGMKHVFEVGHLGGEVEAVVVVASPINLRALNHKHEAVVVAVEGLDGLEGAEGEHATTGHGFVWIVGREETTDFAAAALAHVHHTVDHIIATSHKGVERSLAILSVLGKEMVLVAANHHLEGALGHLKTDAVEELAVGDMGIGGSGGGIEHAAGDHETSSLAEETLGVDKEGVVVGAVGSLGNMAVLHLVSGHEGTAASTRIGGVAVVGIGAGESAVGETQEGTTTGALRHDG